MCMACGSRCDYNEAVTEVRTETMASKRARFEKLAMPVVDALYRQAMKLTNDPDEMIELAREVRPDILHIAGDGYAADEAFAARLKEAAPNTKLMQAVLVDDESAVDRAKKYAQYCDLILTDSGLAPDTGIGASGLTHDWSIDARIVAECGKPVIMAGGLGPDNVAEAIEQCKPYGVDSLTKTSIKYDGGYMEKDIDKVRQFCINADAAAAKIGQ